MAGNASDNEEQSKAEQREPTPDQTLDSVDLSSESDQPASGMSNDDAGKTIESIETGTPPSPEDEAEDGVPDNMQTIDSVELPEGTSLGEGKERPSVEASAGSGDPRTARPGVD